MNYSLPGFSVYGISQARILELVAISSSRGSSYPGIRPASPVFAALQADSLLLCHLGSIYSEYIIRNAGLDDLQTGIRLPGEISKTSDMHHSNAESKEN